MSNNVKYVSSSWWSIGAGIGILFAPDKGEN
jgi:hypothetical protein